ncbi:MAG: ABC transporter substrate-binding protein [Candidatus Heteroscillospira sp.]|jgi:NitT/TauT family transport system substrate-binding protein
MKNLYRIGACILALTMLLALAACGGQTAPESEAPVQSSSTPEPTPTPESTPEPVHVNVAALKGPTGMGMSFLMSASDKGETANDYSFTLTGAPNEVSGAVINGDVDIAAVPLNLAAVLSAKTGNVKILAVNTLGVLYVLENGDSVQSMADLSGKTIQATGQGSTPEYVLSYLLEQNGLTDSVTVEYLTEHSELAASMASGMSALGMLPEPNVTVVTTKNPDVRVALDLTEEWYNVTGTQLVQGCIVVRSDFAEENPEAVEIFLDEYAESVENVNSDTAAAAELIAQYGIVESAAIAEKAIPNCNIVCITGDELRESADAMFEVLFEANPKSVGGAVPGEEIYY